MTKIIKKKVIPPLTNLIVQRMIKKDSKLYLEETYNHQTQTTPVLKASIKDVYKVLVSNSQIRQGGIISKHVNEIRGSVERVGQQLPITVEYDKKGNVVKIVNGCHRVEAIYDLWQKAEEGSKDKKRYSTILAAEIPWSFKNKASREVYQLDLNAPLPVKSNDIADYVAHVFRQVGKLPKKASITAQKQFVSKVETYCKQNFPNMHHKTRNKLVNTVKRGASSSKLENYTPAMVADLVRNCCKNGILSFNWQGKNPGSLSGESYIFPASRTSQITGPNVFGAIYNKLSKDCDPNNYAHGITRDFVVPVWLGDTLGKSNQEVDDHRQNIFDVINAANQGWMLAGGVTRMITKVLLIPQKVEGVDKENLSKIVEAPIDNEGNFTLVKGGKDLRKGW